MERKKTIADYSLHDLPDVVITVLGGRLKLFALIPRRRNLYFLPITGPITDAIPERFIGENEDIEKKYLVTKGKYAISDTDPLIRKLERIYEAGINPDSLGRKNSPQQISLKQVVSPEGIQGCLIESKRLGYMPGYEHSFLQLPFTRILVEEEKGKRQTELDYVLSEFLKNTGNAEGAPALYRFMVDKKEAEILPGNKFRWTDPTGKVVTLSKKRLANRLSELRKNN